MFDYAIKNITKRWVRSLLTIVGVTVMLTLVIVITGIISYQTRTMHAHASAGAGKINIQPLLSWAFDCKNTKGNRRITTKASFLQYYYPRSLLCRSHSRCQAGAAANND